MKMKLAKILFATLAVAACVGCNHTEDGGSTPAPGIKVRVEAGTSESDGTRTEFDGTKTTWSSDDEIKVAAFKGGNFLTEATLSTKSTDVNGTFDGTITESQYQAIPAGSTYDYVAVYPAGATVLNDGQASFTIPASYTATPNSLNGKEFDFMVATADNCASIAVSNAVNDYPVFGFKHVLAFLEITLEGNDPIKTVKVTAPATICGTVSVNPKEYTTAPSVSDDGSNTITVNINGNDTLDEGEKLYVPVIPGIAHTGTLTVELTCASGSTHTITKTLNGKTFTRGLVTKVSKVGYAMADGCVSLGEVRSYVENNANNAVSDVNGLQVSATLTDNTLKTDEITFYWSESANGEGTVINGTENVSGQTVTLTAANAAWNDKDIYVWAKVNHNGNVKTTARKQVYVIGSGDVLTTSVYTSYSKYLVRDISAANACDAYTIYNAGYTLAKSVPSRLITKAVSSSATGNLTGQSMGEHTLSGSVTIGGKTFDYTDKVHITGLPYKETPPTNNANRWSWNRNNYEFNSSYLQLNTGNNTYDVVGTLSFNVPQTIPVNFIAKNVLLKSTSAISWPQLKVSCSGTEFINKEGKRDWNGESDYQNFSNSSISLTSSNPKFVFTACGNLARGVYIQIPSLIIEYR